MPRYFLAFALVLTTCATPPTVVLIRIDTDLDPVTELDVVRVEVARQGDTPVYNFEHELRSPLYAQLPGEIDVTARDGDDTRPIAVRVTGTIRSATARSFTREFVVTSAHAKTTVLDVWLARACARGALTCGEGSTCGRLGCEPSVRAELPELLADAVSVVAGTQATCARRAKGALTCWGALPSGGGSLGDTPQPYTDASIGNVQGVAIGQDHRCVISAGPEGARARRLWCVGANSAGQLGVGPAPTRATEPSPVAIPHGDPVEVVAGRDHTCTRMTDRGVWCWGRNETGQLGDGTTTSRFTPVEVQGLAGLVPVALAASDRHNCALLMDGQVACWGANNAGQLGDGSDASVRPIPVRVATLSDAIGVAVGDEHSCAVRATGALVCWGSNTAGQLGVDAGSGSRVPLAMLDNVASAVVGAAHSCALRRSGEVYCWGSNEGGQLGVPGVATQRRPTRVSNLQGVVQLTAGRSHTCALLGTGSVRCWGTNTRGQLGDGTRGDRTAPVGVQGFP